MKVTVADHAGFCYGVKRAVGLTEKLLNENSGVSTIGDIIHNPQVMELLQEKGLEVVNYPEQINNNIFVIRSHGLSPDTIKNLNGKDLIDATCPHVKAIHHQGITLKNSGYKVIIIGDRGHPEVEAAVGWIGAETMVIGAKEDLSNFPFFDRIGVVVQTTYSDEDLEKVIPKLASKTKEMKFINTICSATRDRQQAAKNIAHQVDLMIVVGGKNSANTRRLVSICQDTGVPTYHIETPDELRSSWLQKIHHVGITAGASTPDWMIKEVVEKMAEISENEQLNNQEVGSMDNEASAYEETFKNLHSGQIVKGEVVKVTSNEVLVDVGYKSDGIIPLNELEKPEEVKEGDEIEVYIVKMEDREGNLILSKKRADAAKAWVKIEEQYKSGEYITAKVKEAVKGGLIVDLGIRGFVPASQVERRYVEDLKQFVGQELTFKIIEFQREKNKVVLSRKIVLEEESRLKRDAVWNNIEEGQICSGTVTKITDFGAFVDLNGVEGLVHISELSWKRVKHPSQVVKEGDQVDVLVLGVDKERERISLGLKQTKPDPWTQASINYPVGSVVTGKVVRVVDFGAFVQLPDGIEGLVHVSQLSHDWVAKPEDAASVGQEVNVKVLDLNQEERRISLSIKEASPKPENEDAKQETTTKEKNKNNVVEPQPTVPNQQEDTRVTIGDVFGDLFEENK